MQQQIRYCGANTIGLPRRHFAQNKLRVTMFLIWVGKALILVYLSCIIISILAAILGRVEGGSPISLVRGWGHRTSMKMELNSLVLFPIILVINLHPT